MGFKFARSVVIVLHDHPNLLPREELGFQPCLVGPGLTAISDLHVLGVFGFPLSTWSYALRVDDPAQGLGLL